MKKNAATLLVLMAVLSLLRPEQAGEIIAVGIPASVFCLVFIACCERRMEAEAARKRERERELDREIESLQDQIRELEG